LDDLELGIHFLGICNKSTLEGNDFFINEKDLVVGLVNGTNTAEGSTEIGLQGDWSFYEGWGNIWHDTPYSTAHHSGTQDIIDMSPFLVKEDPVAPEGYLPKNIEASGDRFCNDAFGNLDPCFHGEGVVTIPECELLIMRINQIDTLSGMDDCTKVMWQYKYFEQLLDLKKEGTLSTLCENFLSQQIGNIVLQMAKIGYSIDSLNQQKIMIGKWKENVGARDSLTQSADSIRLVIENIQVVDSCLAVLNIVNKVRLKQIENDTLSLIDLTTLEPIADACPNDLGEAVYWARGLLSMYQNKRYPDFEDCFSDGKIEPRLMNAERQQSEKLQVFPNPASDNVNIVVNLSEYESGEIVIQDIHGNIFNRKTVDEFSKKIFPWPNGDKVIF